MNNPYKKQKLSKSTKITIITYILTAIITLIVSISITAWVSSNKQANLDFTETPITEEDVRVNSEEFDMIAEKNQVDSLIKSYITASVLGEKSILLELTTAELNTQLNSKEITKVDNVNFLSNTLLVDTISLTELEGMFSVKYVLEYNGENTQQNQTFYTVKMNNRWKISNLVNE